MERMESKMEQVLIQSKEKDEKIEILFEQNVEMENKLFNSLNTFRSINNGLNSNSKNKNNNINLNINSANSLTKN